VTKRTGLASSQFWLAKAMEVRAAAGEITDPELREARLQIAALCEELGRTFLEKERAADADAARAPRAGRDESKNDTR
jgi:hypothetical protein